MTTGDDVAGGPAASLLDPATAERVGDGTGTGGLADEGPAPSSARAGVERVLRFLEPHRGGRFSALDGFRAVAALGVVVYHVAGYANLTGSDSLLSRFLNNLGNFGVATFFLLSGFLLYRPFVMNWFRDEPAPDPFVFLRHRVLRIFPAYFIALGVFLYLGLGNANAAHSGDWYFTLFSLTQVYRKAYGFAGISVAWTLSIELSFYLVLPLIAAGIRIIGHRAHTMKMKLEAQLVGLGLMYVVGFVYRVTVAGPKQYSGKFDVEHLWLPNYLDWFALGMLLCVAVCWTDLGRGLPNLVRRVANTGWLCWIVAGVFYFTLMLLRETSSATAGGVGRETTVEMCTRFFCNGAAAFFFLLPGMLGQSPRSLIRRGLSSIVPMFLGTISYGIYLWHKVWLDYLKTGHDKPDTRYAFWPMLAMVLALTLVTAAVSYYLLERPIMRFKDPKRLRRRATTATTT